MRKVRLGLLIGMGLLSVNGLFAGAYTVPIEVANTGAGSPGESQADPNWSTRFCGSTLASCTTTEAIFNPAFTLPAGQFPMGPWWQPDDSMSQWVSPQPAYTIEMSDAMGVWHFRTSFVLPTTGTLTSAELIFRFAADNKLLGYKLNDTSGSVSTPGGYESISGWETIGAGFQQGVNILDFYVLNDFGGPGNPTGLRVEFGESVANYHTPEPGSLLLLGGGMAAIGFWGRRRASRLQ